MALDRARPRLQRIDHEPLQQVAPALGIVRLAPRPQIDQVPALGVGGDVVDDAPAMFRRPSFGIDVRAGRHDQRVDPFGMHRRHLDRDRGAGVMAHDHGTRAAKLRQQFVGNGGPGSRSNPCPPAADRNRRSPPCPWQSPDICRRAAAARRGIRPTSAASDAAAGSAGRSRKRRRARGPRAGKRRIVRSQVSSGVGLKKKEMGMKTSIAAAVARRLFGVWRGPRRRRSPSDS